MLTFSEVIGAFKGKLSVFKKHPPVRTAEDFGEFLATRSAYIAQKSLYGYLKTRMGMNYPKMFEDDVFVQSINTAKWNHYAACLSDLVIYMSAKLFESGEDRKNAAAMARYWHTYAVVERFQDAGFHGNTADILDEFEERLRNVDWEKSAEGEGAFTTSPPSLVQWAPIAEHLKRYDEPLVLNSIRFSWQAIRREFVRLLDREAVLADWQTYPRSASSGIRPPKQAGVEPEQESSR